jgi:DNA-binding transcriptional regulator YdaS (Cro superfamily)
MTIGMSIGQLMAIEHDSESELAKAVRKAGSQSAFGRLIGRNQSVVHGWLKEHKPLPAEHVLLVERELSISRHRLRPDLYPREAATAPPAPPSHDDDAAPLEPAR